LYSSNPTYRCDAEKWWTSTIDPSDYAIPSASSASSEENMRTLEDVVS
jgi:hypothetical protein